LKKRARGRCMGGRKTRPAGDKGPPKRGKKKATTRAFCRGANRLNNVNGASKGNLGPPRGAKNGKEKSA